MLAFPTFSLLDALLEDGLEPAVVLAHVVQHRDVTGRQRALQMPDDVESPAYHKKIHSGCVCKSLVRPDEADQPSPVQAKVFVKKNMNRV